MGGTGGRKSSARSRQVNPMSMQPYLSFFFKDAHPPNLHDRERLTKGSADHATSKPTRHGGTA